MLRGHLLVIGAGDIGRRVIGQLPGAVSVSAATSTPGSRGALRRLGARPVFANLDQPGTLKRLPGQWDMLLHCAPPPATGARDTRTRNILRWSRPGMTAHKPTSLSRGPRSKATRSGKRVVVYLSTSGVYGDCGGARISESQALKPQNARAVRRVDAERALVRAARRGAFRLIILRVPGIYSETRLPIARLEAGTPALRDEDDVYTNHIHAADLACIALAGLRHLQKRTRPPVRVYHASDDSEMKMGEYFDLVADAFGLPHPPRLPRAEIAKAVSPALLSFMRESRRMDNSRLKQELHFRWQARDVAIGVQAAVRARHHGDSTDT